MEIVFYICQLKSTKLQLTEQYQDFIRKGLGNMKIGNFKIHRKNQFDLKGIKTILCIHKTYDRGNGSKRVFMIGVKNRKLVFKFTNPFKYRY